MSVLHIAPHLDDETLGCGGTLLAHIAAGDPVHWLLVTDPEPAADARARVDALGRAYGFAGIHLLALPDRRLDVLPLGDLIEAFSDVVRQVRPHTIYVPHPADVHSDHRRVFEAAIPCTKRFRFPSVHRVLAYETPSETNFGLGTVAPFRPTVYRDITPHLDRKIAILHACVPDELGPHPFPRSETAVRALAMLRGSEAGVIAAEAFELLREIL
jgi:N-acetylglucosamine malate deacetylase 1